MYTGGLLSRSQNLGPMNYITNLKEADLQTILCFQHQFNILGFPGENKLSLFMTLTKGNASMKLNKILSAPCSLRQRGIPRISLGRKKAKKGKERERKEEREKKEGNEGLRDGGKREKEC